MHFGACASHIFSHRTPTGGGAAAGAELATGAREDSGAGSVELAEGGADPSPGAGVAAFSAGFGFPHAAAARTAKSAESARARFLTRTKAKGIMVASLHEARGPRLRALRDPGQLPGQALVAMRFPPLSILSVGAALGFACTGEDGGNDPNARESGGETGIGGASSGGSSNGGGPSTGGSGISGSSGNANGGNGASGGDGETGGAAGSDGGAAGESGAGGAGGEGGAAPPSILLFSRTTGFRHESIPDAVSALVQIAAEHDWLYRYTEDPTIFSDEGLSPFSVVVFALTSGDVLDGNQEAAFERFVRAGGGFVGIHSASHTEYD